MSTFLVVRGIFSSILKPSVDLYIRYEAALWKEELVHDTIIIMGESDTLVPSKMISSYLHDISLGQADAFADETLESVNPYTKKKVIFGFADSCL